MPGFNIQGLGADANPRAEYYYNYTWEIDNLFGSGISPSSAVIYAKDATLPSQTLNKETYISASIEYKFAKNVTWDDVKISWYDTKGLADYVREWRRSVWTPETGLKPASEYKRMSKISSFLPTGKSRVSWFMYNSWPSVIRSGDLTYTDSNVKMVEVTITYDWAEDKNE